MAAITVKALADLLATLPPDAIVVLAKDAEGNSFSPLQADESHSVGQYSAQRPWCGEFFDDESIADEGAPDGGVSAICLWPTN